MKKIRTGLLFAGLFSAMLSGAAVSVESGKVWPDDASVHINAHGGGVLFYNSTYYWYGEHKVEGSAGNRAQVGVHVYSSGDLLNWKDEGIALPVSEDPESDIFKGCILERPKVIYNRMTKKFVMWFHLELVGRGYSSARSGVAVSDSPTGPFTFIRSVRPDAGTWPVNAPEAVTSPQAMAAFEKEHEGFMGREFKAGQQKSEEYNQFMSHWHQPDHRLEIYRRDFATGQFARDMTLFVDDDQTAYHIFASEENQTLHISRLSDDYLSHAGEWSRVQVGDANEAPAIFKHNGKYYLLASGCTGWAPNAARSFVSDFIFGPYKSLGNPCDGVNPQNKLGAEKTFGGQSTYILPVEGKKDLFIAMFDEWRPRNPIDGRYYWLPITLTDDAFRIEWVDKWSPAD